MSRMKPVIRRYYQGKFNSVILDGQSDGSVIITLSNRADDKKYIYHVRNLYKEDEEVLDYQEVKKPKKKSSFMLDRIDKAKRGIPE